MLEPELRMGWADILFSVGTHECEAVVHGSIWKFDYKNSDSVIQMNTWRISSGKFERNPMNFEIMILVAPCHKHARKFGGFSSFLTV